MLPYLQYIHVHVHVHVHVQLFELTHNDYSTLMRHPLIVCLYLMTSKYGCDDF